ncbi:MAG: hypothetical protein SGPRY_009901 [Prymnesium sp.]
MLGYYHEEGKAKRGDGTDVTVCGRVVGLEKKDERSFVLSFSQGEQMLLRAETVAEAQRWVAKIETHTGFSQAEEMPPQAQLDQVTHPFLPVISRQCLPRVGYQEG